MAVTGPACPFLPARGSRLETEFIGFAANRARTVAAAGLDFSKIPARGSRLETEINGFAGNRARTVAAAGLDFSKIPA